MGCGREPAPLNRDPSGSCRGQDLRRPRAPRWVAVKRAEDARTQRASYGLRR